MRRTLARGAVAALVAAVATVSGGASPAQADIGSLRTPITQMYDALASGGQPAQVVGQVAAAVAGIRTEALAEVDRVPIADARTCAARHLTEFAGLPQLSPNAAKAWARDATACVALIDSHLQTAQVRPPQPNPVVPADGKATVDRLGLAVNVVGPIAIAARLHTGLGNDELRQVLARANSTVVTKIEPWCSEARVYEDDSHVFELWFVCYAYNFHEAYRGMGEAFQLWAMPFGCEPWHSCEEWPLGPPVDKDLIRSTAMQYTSWVVARDVLPLL
nr:hypothetical protein [Micromonospora sp. DSM 115978]